MWTSCILQHSPLLISVGLYQQLNYSLHLVTSSAFIGTVEDLEHTSIKNTTVTNALPAELRRNVGRPLYEITYTRCENNNFWSTFMRIQTSDLPMLLLGTLPADRCKGHAQKIISCVNDHKASNLRP